MAEPPPYPNAGDDTGAGLGPGSTTGTPRWVKAFGIITLVLGLLVVALMFAGGGRHGPGRHIPSGGAGDHAGPIAVGVHQP